MPELKKPYVLNRIEEVREHQGLSRKELGELLQPSKSGITIWRYETGITQPSLETLRDIAIALNVETSYLILVEPRERPWRRQLPKNGTNGRRTLCQSIATKETHP